jgi:hypothetical protein
MTENQQRIISQLVAEFNSRNEQQSKRPFKLIDVDEFDAINQRHLELKADAQRTKNFWDDECDRYIDDLIPQLREDIGDRLCVQRGNKATGNHNCSEYILIYKYNTNEYYIWEKALRMRFNLIKESRRDDVTREYYDYYTGLEITRYVNSSMEVKYKDEVEFFNCQYTKDKLKDLLS